MSPELTALVLSIGYLGLFLVVLFESGLFGFFLPGSSLLFVAGFLSSQNHLNIIFVLCILFSASVMGNCLSYALGAKYGKRLFEKQTFPFLQKAHLLKTEQFYEKHGGKTILLARFIPIVRAFAPFVAGMARMRLRPFLLYNVLGGLLWGVGVPLLGYILGASFPTLGNYIFPLIGIIVILLLIPKLVRFLFFSNQNRI